MIWAFAVLIVLLITGLAKSRLQWWFAIVLFFVFTVAATIGILGSSWSLLAAPPVTDVSPIICAVIAATDIALIFVIFRKRDANPEEIKDGGFTGLVSPTGMALLVTAVLSSAIYFGGYRFAVHCRFPVETRYFTKTGVEFSPQKYEELGHEQLASATWWSGGLFIRRAIYDEKSAGVFVFTSTGLVFVFEGNENNDPPDLVDFFWCVGDPHQFAFSKRWYSDGP